MNKIQKITLGVSSSVSGLVLAATPALAQLGDIDIPDQGFASSIGSLFSSILNLVMLIAAILVFMYLILGGIEWITSGGDKAQTEKARNKITAAIVGLIILAASYALLQLLLSLLGFSNGIQELFDAGIRPINS
ncbi:MAG: hypothetical protein XD95_0235 [Microgenomates bacterium 39_7]|nr:MAG: hypothetical protein XD95_0235 [Microgenomates bacterium 39_7]